MTRLMSLVVLILMHSIYCTGQKADMVLLANQFINTLNKEEKVKALFPFDEDERYNFHFVPRDNRKGISINEMNEKQREAAMALIKSCFSAEGFRKATAIMQLEIILKAIEKRKEDDHYRDPGKYFVSIFGAPEKSAVWGWRIEGHHVAFNFSAENNELVATTPGFMGSNPAVVPEGPQKGMEILASETAKGFALLHSFSNDQLKAVIMDTTAPADILTFDSRKALIEHPAGIGWNAMNSMQQQNLLQLIEVYVHRYTKLFADAMMKEIKEAGLQNLRFAWSGAREPGIGNPHYYRVQGPTMIIEYDNTQNNANHVHAVIRDLKRDFGGDALLEHYKTTHR